MFERFTTGGAATDGGTGLGLAIARWVTQLHGGPIEVADPEPPGPAAGSAPTLPDPSEPRMSGAATTSPARSPPVPRCPRRPVPDDGCRPTVAGAATCPPSAARRGGAAASALLAATVLPDRELGLGTFVVLLAVGGVVVAADGRLRTLYHLASAVLCTLLLATLVLRDAEWIMVLCLLAAVARRRRRHSPKAGRSSPCWRPAGRRAARRRCGGCPGSAARSTAGRPAGTWLPAVRTAVVSTVLLVVFGALFASADALFASWVGRRRPGPHVGRLLLRGFVARRRRRR